MIFYWVDNTTRVAARIAWAICVMICLAGCDPSTGRDEKTPVQCEIPEISESAVVRVEDGKFSIDGSSFLPQGINSYPLLQHIGDGNANAVLDVFAQATQMGRPFVRTNAFMDGGTNPARIREDDGSIREEGLQAMDQLLDLARASGIKLLLVLTNNWDDYGGAQAVVDASAPGENLPKDAFWSEPRAVAAQREYVQTLALRVNGLSGRIYGKIPTVLGWVLANEARCDDGEWCDGETTLVQWARIMADTMKAAGAVQPIAWGGVGYFGRHGENIEAIAKDGAVDILTLHIYPEVSYPMLRGLPAHLRVQLAIDIGADIMSAAARIAVREKVALIVEEFGWRPPGDGDRERALIYNGWLGAALDLEIPVFPWMIGETDRVDYDGLLIRPEHGETVEAISCVRSP